MDAAGAILDFGVKMVLYHQNNVRFEILVVSLAEKVSLYMILGALVKKLSFQHGHWMPSWISG